MMAPQTPDLEAIVVDQASKQASLSATAVFIDTYPPENASDIVDDKAQAGVQAIEAVTLTWTKQSLVFAYAIMWLIFFAEALLSVLSASLSPYVASAFLAHSLTPTVSVISTIVGGVCNVTIAKVLDVFGRPQGYAFSLLLAVVGLCLTAGCKTVEAYAAANVFYTVGNNGLQYSISVMIADTTSLKNRGLIQALLWSPNIITCWLGGPVSSAFLRGPGWRWGFGTFAIIIPACSAPLLALFTLHYQKAKKLGLVPARRVEGEARWHSMAIHCKNFDVLGVLFLSAGVAFFLLPFNIHALQAKGWSASICICFWVLGIVMGAFFVLWEVFWAPVTIFPWEMLKDRTMLGACITSFGLFMTNSIWSSYFSSVLQVVNNLSVTHASYIVQIQTVGGFITSLTAGYVMRRTGHFKPVTLLVGIPMCLLGQGLFIHFRHAQDSIGFIVMCMILQSFGSGILALTSEIAGLATGSHQYVAMVIAVLGLFCGIGGSVGLTISSAIWQGTLPDKLAAYLPAKDLPNLTLIFEDLPTALSYSVGSPARTAIQMAYSDTQKLLMITATAAWGLCLIGGLMWKNIDLRVAKQTKGHVF